jgi:ribonuclease Z
MTAKQAAFIAKESNVDQLVLTHFSARYQDLAEFEQEAQAIFPNTVVADDLKQFPFPK